MVVQVPDDEFGIVGPAPDGFIPCDESPFRPLPVGIEIAAAFEFDAVQMSGKALEFFHQRFSDPAAARWRSHTKVGNGCHTTRNPIEEIAKDFTLAIRGDKERAHGDAFLKRSAWHEAKCACVLAVKGKHVIAPALIGEVADGN